MTALALSFGDLVWSGLDRGVSDDAQILSRLIAGVAASEPSLTRVNPARLGLLDRINEVARNATSPNWDGEGARPVSFSTVGYARLLVSALPSGIPAPEVNADRDGDIVLEWDFGPRRVFSVSMRRDGVLNYAGLFGPTNDHGSEVFFGGVPPSVITGIRRAQEGDRPSGA